MNTIQNIKKVALIFFILTGSAHLLGALFLLNEYYIQYSYVIFHVSDTPFLFSAVIYSLACLKLKLSRKEKNHSIVLDTILIIITIIIIISALYISLFIPDKI